MKTLIISKAVSLPLRTYEGCLIKICNPLPQFAGKDWHEESMVFFEGEASVIVDALQANLPGGTFDAVLRELLKRKASSLRVPIGI